MVGYLDNLIMQVPRSVSYVAKQNSKTFQKSITSYGLLLRIQTMVIRLTTLLAFFCTKIIVDCTTTAYLHFFA